MDSDERHRWTRSEPEQVAPGVVRIALPLPDDALRAVNVYVLLGGTEGLTVVDGGWALARSRELLATGLRGLGADPADIARFLVTHVHRDHYTQAVALRREVGAHVALGRGEEGSLTSIQRAEAPLQAQVDGLRLAGAGALADEVVAAVAGMGDGERADFEDPDEWIDDGAVLPVSGRTLTAVETPGHSRGHLIYVDEAAGLCFAGDHVLPHITPSIGFEPAARPGALRRYLDSLARVRAMPDRTLLPAHGPVSDSVHARVDALLSHHARRLDEIAGVTAQGAATAAEVAAALTWTRHEKGLEDLETVHRGLAVLETDAHLEVLAAQERVARTMIDGVAHHTVL